VLRVLGGQAVSDLQHRARARQNYQMAGQALRAARRYFCVAARLASVGHNESALVWQLQGIDALSLALIFRWAARSERRGEVS